jgi:hypothetical protein
MKKQVVNSKLRRHWSQMDAAELAKETAQFDEEFLGKFPPLTKEMRAQHARAKLKRGRPKRGRGAKIVSVSLESTLLKATDSLAKRRGISRSQIVALGLIKMLKEGRLAS